MSDTGDGKWVAHEAFVRALKPGNATLFEELLKSTKVGLGFALQERAKAKDLELVTWLLVHDTGCKIYRDSLIKALHCAITPDPAWPGTPLSRRRRLVEVLLQHGAEVNSPHKVWGSALRHAAASGEPEIVEILIGNGVDINARLEPCGTPLMLALQGNHPSVAKLLLSRGANVKHGIPDCGAALHLAAMIGLEGNDKTISGSGSRR
jgi:hypothetical protein